MAEPMDTSNGESQQIGSAFQKLNKSISCERKRRVFVDFEWEGPVEDIISRVTTKESYAEANNLLVMLRVLRSDIPQDTIHLLELHSYLKFGLLDEANNYLQETTRSYPNFMIGVIDHVADIFKNSGAKGIICFKGMKNECFFEDYIASGIFDRKTIRELVQTFNMAIDDNKERGCEYLLCLQIIRPDTRSAILDQFMKLLHSVPEPPLGLIHFGNSLTVGGQPAFGNFANEEILFIASNILKTSVIEHRKDIVGDSQSCKLRMDECARDFIQSNYLFFYAVLTKFKTPLFENNPKKASLIIKHILEKLSPNGIQPTSTIALGYALALCRLKLPNTIKSHLVLPWVDSYKRSREEWKPRRNIAIPQPSEFLFRCDFLRLHNLAKKFQTSSDLFIKSAQLAGYDEIMHHVALTYLLFGQMQKCVDFCKSIDKTPKFQLDFQMKCIELAAHYNLGNKNEVVELIFPILKTCIDKAYLEPSRDIYDSEKKKKKKKVEKKFWFLSCKNTLHWLCYILNNVLMAYIAQGNRNDVILGTLLIISQLSYKQCGHVYFSEGLKAIRQKKKFRMIGFLDYIIEPGALEIICSFMQLPTNRAEFLVHDTQERKALATRRSANTLWNNVEPIVVAKMKELKSNEAPKDLKIIADFLDKYKTDLKESLTST
ncbi:hypothetical protein WR25_13102 [Diploscapter pachys]|uniref:Uncharacterized protein n=1 Tax=Diploscapter pachys TaxID=2018661 RepID=A0A2A2LGF6_9BILA|nr:hypothetical protein WR25_13102 [Diploscapter pachys]